MHGMHTHSPTHHAMFPNRTQPAQDGLVQLDTGHDATPLDTNSQACERILPKPVCDPFLVCFTNL